jgi:hypothetical protein
VFVNRKVDHLDHRKGGRLVRRTWQIAAEKLYVRGDGLRADSGQLRVRAIR